VTSENDDPELAEAAQRAASASPSPDCPSDRHGSYQAHRRHGCRCPETNVLISLQRSRWEVNSRADREFRRILERQAVREEIVQELLKGNRLMPHRFSERREAFKRALAEHGEDVEALSKRLNFPRKEIQRKLRAWRGGS
jgi:hypothetical protein